MKTICVFCGSSNGNKSFEDQTRLLGQAFGRHKINLVYGGGSLGLMGILAQTVSEQPGCSVTGIIPHALNRLTQPIGQNIVVNTMHERKKMMSDLSDGFIALPGGFGTLEELFEVITWSQLRIHCKPIAIFNVDGYYDHLIRFLDEAVSAEFINKSARKCVVEYTNVDQLLDALVNFQDPYQDSQVMLSAESWQVSQKDL